MRKEQIKYHHHYHKFFPVPAECRALCGSLGIPLQPLLEGIDYHWEGFATSLQTFLLIVAGGGECWWGKGRLLNTLLSTGDTILSPLENYLAQNVTS